MPERLPHQSQVHIASNQMGRQRVLELGQVPIVFSGRISPSKGTQSSAVGRKRLTLEIERLSAADGPTI